MPNRGIGIGKCDLHGEYWLDAPDSECPSCQDGKLFTYRFFPCFAGMTPYEEDGLHFDDYEADHCADSWAVWLSTCRIYPVNTTGTVRVYDGQAIIYEKAAVTL